MPSSWATPQEAGLSSLLVFPSSRLGLNSLSVHPSIMETFILEVRGPRFWNPETLNLHPRSLGSLISWCFLFPDGKSGGTPLGCILSNGSQFDLQTLKKKRLVFLYNTAWPQYQLAARQSWPLHGILNHNTISQLDVFCKQLGRWGEIPYIQAFFYLRGRHDMTCAPNIS